MKRLILFYLYAVIFIGCIYANTNSVANAYFVNQTFTNASIYPTGWADATSYVGGNNASINWASPAANQLNVIGSGAGSRGWSISFPSSGAATTVYVDFDFYVTSSTIGQLNAFGLHLHDNAGNIILSLYACGNDAKWHYWNTQKDSTTFNGGSFQRAGSSLTVTNTRNSGSATTLPYSTGVWYNLQATIDFTGHVVTNMVLTNKTTLASVSVPSKGFISVSASNLSIVSALNTRSNNVTNGGNADLNISIDNFKTYQSANFHTWTGAASTTWDNAALNFTSDGSTNIAYPGSLPVSFPVSATTKTVVCNSALTIGNNPINIDGAGYSITGTGSLAGTGALNINLAGTDALTLGVTNNLTGVTQVSGGNITLSKTLALGSNVYVSNATTFIPAASTTFPTMTFNASSTISCSTISSSISGMTAGTGVKISISSTKNTANDYAFDFAASGTLSSGSELELNGAGTVENKFGMTSASTSYLANTKVTLKGKAFLFIDTNQGAATTINVGTLSGESGTKIGWGKSSDLNRHITWSVGASNLSSEYAGTITNTGGYNTGGNFFVGNNTNFTKVGNGTLTFSGNSYSHNGKITVSGGELQVTGKIGNTQRTNYVYVNGATLSTMNGGKLFATKLIMDATAQLKIGSTSIDSIKYVGGSAVTNVEIQANASNGGKFVIVPDSAITIGALTITSSSAPTVGTQIQLIVATDPTKVTYTNTPVVPLGYSFNTTTGVLTYNGTTVSSDVTLTTIPSNGVVTVNSGLLTINQNAALNSLTIAPGAKVTLASGRTLAASTITLQGDPTTGSGTFMDPSGAATVTAVVQQTMLGTSSTIPRGWWYVSSPVSNATAAVFIPNGSTNKFGYWNEPTFNYPQINITNNATTTLEVGKGYVFNNTGGDAAINFSGTLNTGDKTIYPTRTGTENGSRGFNLVGNPYPSYLDWNAATKVNVRSTIWYRTWASGGGGMTFDTYDGTTGTGNGVSGAVSNLIPPMQGFWVKVNADGDNASITFHNNDRAHKGATSNLLRTKASGATLPGIVRLRVSNGLNSDETILVGDENASDAADSYDSPKMKNNNALIPEIYTLAGTEELVINHLNSISANKELTLGFRPGKTGDFSISANELSNIDSDIRVILKDNEQPGEYDLTDGTAYTFSSGVTETTSRFSIVFRSASVTTGQQALNSNKVLVSCNENSQLMIQINGEIGTNCQVAVYNSIGQKMISEQLTQTKHVFDTVFVPGVYVVTLNNGGQKLIKKVVIK